MHEYLVNTINDIVTDADINLEELCILQGCIDDKNAEKLDAVAIQDFKKAESCRDEGYVLRDNFNKQLQQSVKKLSTLLDKSSNQSLENTLSSQITPKTTRAKVLNGIAEEFVRLRLRSVLELD